MLAFALLPGLFALSRQEPLFTFVQTSDSQPANSADQLAFEEGMDVIADSGSPGALLRRRVSFVLFAGDLTDGDSTSEWISWTATVDSRLTAAGIPLLAVPGNHDRSNGDFTRYEQFIADTAPWSAGSAALTGHNGVSITTGYAGLRFIGVNNTNGDANIVSSADLSAAQSLVNTAAANSENAFVMVHHPHDASGRMPLRPVLETPGVVGFMRGHSGSPDAGGGLSGIDNDDLWEFNTNSLYEDGALVYYEAFESELHAYVIELDSNPTSLPSRVVVPLRFDLRPDGSEPPPPPPPTGTVKLAPVADAGVHSSRPTTNFGLDPELRLRNDGGSSIWRSYLRFDLSSIQTSNVTSATLRLYCTDSSSDGGALHQVSDSWSETGLNYGNAPAPGTQLRAAQSTGTNEWEEFDVRGAIVGGTRAFALVSGSNNGAIYSSRQGSRPPELVIELTTTPVLAIQAIVPPAIDLFVPGTAETVRIEGSAFGAGTNVDFDGAELPASAFTVVNSGLITVDLPPAGIGNHTLRVRDGSSSDSVTVQAVLPATPRLQVGNGDANNVIESGDPLRILASGPIGSRQVVSMSLSLSPSVIPALSLLIGANFTDLRVVTTLTIPSSGYAEFQFPAQTNTALTVYAQATSWIGGPPFATSNLQSIQIVP